VVFSSLDYAVR